MPNLIREIGLRYHSPAKKRVRFAIYECPKCGTHYESRCYLSLEPFRKSCKTCVATANATKHGNSKHPAYVMYSSMISRCHNHNDSDFQHYGGRGITVCSEWRHNFENFAVFCESKGFKKGLSIERIDNSKGYSTDNCTFIPTNKQQVNRRKFKNNTSGYKGVSFQKSNNKFKAYIGHNSKFIYLGMHKTAEAAAQAYNDYIDANKLPHDKNVISL